MGRASGLPVSERGLRPRADKIWHELGVVQEQPDGERAFTLGALGAGFGAALWLAMAPRRAQRWGLAATAAMLALPAFLITGCWLRLLGQTGVWRSWLP